MCPSPEELSKTDEATAPVATAELSPACVAKAPDSKPVDCCCTSASKGWRPPVLVYTGFSLVLITFALWILFSWSGYADKYSQINDGFHLGSTKLIEITLVREDKDGLACASDVAFEGNRCGFGNGGTPLGANGPDELHTFRPYNTVKNELFVGAGLWSSPALSGELPKERFSVVCNYRVLGVVKSIAMRWGAKAAFDPLKHGSSVTVGTLSDCVIPQ